MELSEFFEKAKGNIETIGFPIIEDEKTKIPLYISLREFPLRYQLGISKIRKFFEGLRDGIIYATQCNKCHEKFFPPRTDCPKCLNSDITWVPLETEGELLTYTVISVKPLSFAHYKDYIVGIARLKDGLKVLAWLNVDDLKKVKPGLKVRLTVVKRAPEGNITYELIEA